MSNTPVRITRGDNPYAREVQGKANEPITVAALLDRARARLSAIGQDMGALDGVTLEAIYDRLHENAPRVAIIGGSPDHPAHIVDLDTTAYAAARIWERGGVPFSFSVPVLCDGTAQSNTGMCYSLASRNITTAAVVNQMEAHSYHGAFVIQGCDKQPLAVVAALAMLDVVRRERGDAPVFATFAPAHVLRGGTIPDDLRRQLLRVADVADDSGHADIADDLRDTLKYILQCSSNTAFQGVLTRAREEGIITKEEHGNFEKRLAVNTCDAHGGICAFNGTGNSSRHVVSALGLVHPAVELLTAPATPANVNPAVDALMGYCDDPSFSVSEMVRRNLEMAVRVHSATGGSTNIMMHLVAVALCAGLEFDVWAYDRIRRYVDVPDIFNYSLTEGRDIFALAQQCCAGQIRGMETAIYELHRLGVPVPLDAPTATGQTWRERLSDTANLSADGVKENPIILSTPRRAVSGIDVLTGNWFESAVVKISGMPESQVDEFDRHVAAVVYFENEDAANDALLDAHFLDKLRDRKLISRAALLAMRNYHAHLHGKASEAAVSASGEELFDRMVAERSLRLAVIISGQGPEAYGMPEMFTPMQHINANRVLRRLTILLSDGRYSGVTYGAAIGHITPEALRGGAIGALRDGDLLHIRLRERRIDWLDSAAFADGQLQPLDGQSLANLKEERREIIAARLAAMKRRARTIAPTNRLVGVTDAARGVVPLAALELTNLMAARS
ncbi:MAG TPA: dihydroxy-acid dehydratase [Blastocatellia bacterium]|nr:dihydroxy-acid dehydratase [Blastocatellia bacterium]